MKQAREKWDASRRAKGNGKRPKVDGSGTVLPLPPNKKTLKAGPGGAAAAAAYWDIVGETSFLPPRSEVPSLKERAAWVAAECIDRAPEVRCTIESSVISSRVVVK